MKNWIKKNIYIIELGLECKEDDKRSKKLESEIENRIRESEESCQVKPHSKPWIVRLRLGDADYCGGTLIGTKTVVTAAHCLGNLAHERWKQTTVIIGDHHRTDSDCGDDRIENEQCFNVTVADWYKDWNGNVFCPFSIRLYFK